MAYALLTYAQASGEQLPLDAASEVGNMLVDCALPHPDGGWVWPETLGGARQRIQAQCHGAIGIGQFLLRLAQSRSERYASAAGQAAITARRELARRPTAGLCHGVSGDGMFLLECAAALADPQYADWARDAQAVLASHQVPNQSGRYSSLPFEGRPELLTGDAGVGWFHLALAAPDRIGDPILGKVIPLDRGTRERKPD
jgi:hypothetical protein